MRIECKEGKKDTYRSAAKSRDCCRLVGVATVAKTGHWLLDWFLRLPTDVLGVMAVSLKWHLDEEQQEVQPATVDESACHN